MAYIGNSAPSRFVSNRAATQFSGNGSNKIFTLEQVVTQDEDILVSVDGVIQEPSVAYVVSSGTTLTFQGTDAPSANAGNNIFVYYLASQTGTVGHPSTQGLAATSGTFSTTLASTGNATVGGTLGVTGVATFTETPTYATGKDPFNSVIETWYYDNTDTSHANNAILTRGYTRLTTNATANKNGGMAHATAAGTGGSGIWTFPSTGIWRVELHLSFAYSGAALGNGIIIQITTNNSTYVDVHGLLNHGNENNANQNIILPYVLNVSNTTNVKFKHKVSSGNAITIKGNGEVFDTKINFIKLSN